MATCFDMVRDARSRGLTVPVIFMGYYNPILSYGEDRLMADAQKAGLNGFLVVDLPPEEAVRFRSSCTRAGYVDAMATMSQVDNCFFLVGSVSKLTSPLTVAVSHMSR